MTRRQKIWLAIGLVVLLPIVVPWFTLSRAKAGILHSLAASLGRSLQADSVHLRLFPLPGVELDGVRLADDPAFGLEDMVMADSASASLEWTALLRGRLVFSRVHLENPSINLVRNAQGEWNVAALLNRTGSIARRAASAGQAQRAASVRLPYLDWSNARINFKLRQTKAHFYLDQVDGSLARESGDWRLQARFVPERSDLRLSNTGTVRVDGRWKAGAASFQDQPFDLAVSLRDSYLAGSSALLVGHDAGLHGILSARLEVRGSGREIHISGTAHAQSLRRWDLLPPPAEVNATFAAVYLPATDQLTLTGVGDPGWAHFQLSGTITDLFTHPQAQLQLSLRQFDAAHLLPLAMALKSHLPADLKVSGSVDGGARLGLAWGQSLPTGAAALRFSGMRLASLGVSLRLPAARLQWDGKGLQLASAAATLTRNGEARTLRLGATLERNGFTLSVASPAMDAASTTALAQLLGLHAPWPPSITGTAALELRLRSPWAQLRQTQWSGRVQFARAAWQPPGGKLPPIGLRPLTVTLGTSPPLAAQFRLAALPLAGTAAWSPSGGLQLRLTSPVRLEAAALEGLLAPQRPDLVQRVFGDVLGAPAAVPAWLLPLHPQIEFDLSRLDWHGIPARVRLQARPSLQGWDSPALDIATAGGHFSGQGSLTAAGYHLTGAVAPSAPLQLGPLLAATPYAGLLSGVLSGRLQLDRPPSGGGMRQLDASGAFLLRHGSLATASGAWRFESCQGQFSLAAGRATLGPFRCWRAGVVYQGRATAEFSTSGTVQYEVTLAHAALRLHLQNPASGPVTSHIPR